MGGGTVQRCGAPASAETRAVQGRREGALAGAWGDPPPLATMSIIGFLDNGATSYVISKAARAYENLCNSEVYHQIPL